MRRRIALWSLWPLWLMMILLPLPALAQEVTQDDVNAVAERLYCPVCENIPLESCHTDACIRWKEEIRLQLEEGRTPDEIVTNFVAQFGERAVGTPQDPTLRALSVYTPFIIAAIALVVGVVTFVSWRRRGGAGSGPVPPPPADTPDSGGDPYRALVERDARR